MPSNPVYFSTTAGLIIATLPTAAGFIIVTAQPAYGRGVIFFFSPDRLCNFPQGVVLRPIWDVGTSLRGTLLLSTFLSPNIKVHKFPSTVRCSMYYWHFYKFLQPAFVMTPCQRRLEIIVPSRYAGLKRFLEQRTFEFTCSNPNSVLVLDKWESLLFAFTFFLKKKKTKENFY